jgi:hypothetical protein
VRGINHLSACFPKEFPIRLSPTFTPAAIIRNGGISRHGRLPWLCHLSGGRHRRWGGGSWSGRGTGCEYDPFEKAVKALAQRQLDCDVVAIDSLLDRNQAITSADGLQINEETYRVIIVPYSECLPEELLERLNDFACLGISVVFMRNLPRRGVAAGQRAAAIIAKLQANPLVTVSEYGNLAEHLLARQIYDIRTASPEDDLYCYHYVRPGEDIYFFINGSTFKAVDTQVVFSQPDHPVGYNALNNSVYQPAFNRTGNETTVEMCLEPYESTFIIFSQKHNELAGVLPAAPLKKNMRRFELNGPWQSALRLPRNFRLSNRRRKLPDWAMFRLRNVCRLFLERSAMKLNSSGRVHPAETGYSLISERSMRLRQ